MLFDFDISFREKTQDLLLILEQCDLQLHLHCRVSEKKSRTMTAPVKLKVVRNHPGRR